MPQSLFGYEVIDTVGEGAGSVIYVVSHPQTRQLYALKHVVRKTEKHARFIEQLENEFEVGRKCSHPNLRRVIDYQAKKTLLGKVTEAALVMELFDGQPLDVNLPRAMTTLVQVFIETGRALEAMHAAGYVHCDLKPNNILLSREGQVKVIDLGQACPIGTKKARIQGTPDYIAPEQVKCLPVSIRTDIYNLGATMYWALSGRKMPTLFTVQKGGDNSLLSDDLLSPPHVINPLVPESLSNFVMECVRINPKKRPADMGEVLRRLEIIQHGIERGTASARNFGAA
ncbi:serine/threonine protein kinase [Fontivita pretiosa]|uniref:serine/threonine protein kinase n=1 Tax=Fontivita pretiosa TaxID=2989684 RepID=UPI003D186A10